MTNEEKFALADKIYFVFMEHLDDSTTAEFIEDDPDVKDGTRNTEKGKELFCKIESVLEVA